MKPAQASEMFKRLIPGILDTDGVGFSKIKQILGDHHAYRQSCVNLIASENLTSPAVTRLQSNELSHRYGDYRGINQKDRKYQGNRHIIRLEQYVTDLVKQLFGAAHADLRPLSGHV